MNNINNKNLPTMLVINPEAIIGVYQIPGKLPGLIPVENFENDNRAKEFMLEVGKVILNEIQADFSNVVLYGFGGGEDKAQAMRRLGRGLGLARGARDLGMRDVPTEKFPGVDGSFPAIYRNYDGICHQVGKKNGKFEKRNSLPCEDASRGEREEGTRGIVYPALNYGGQVMCKHEIARELIAGRWFIAPGWGIHLITTTALKAYYMVTNQKDMYNTLVATLKFNAAQREYERQQYLSQQALLNAAAANS